LSNKVKTSFIGSLLMLSAVHVATSEAVPVKIGDDLPSVQDRLKRLTDELETRKTFLFEQRRQPLSDDPAASDQDLAFWGDFGDAPLWGDFGDIGGFLPGFGDFADSPLWGDWGDLW